MELVSLLSFIIKPVWKYWMPSNEFPLYSYKSAVFRYSVKLDMFELKCSGSEWMRLRKENKDYWFAKENIREFKTVSRT